jgi:hypothetical protein
LEDLVSEEYRTAYRTTTNLKTVIALNFLIFWFWKNLQLPESGYW